MKDIKSYIIWFLSCACLFLTSCNTDKRELVGTWKSKSANMSYLFKGDDTGEIDLGALKIDIEWALSMNYFDNGDNNLFITFVDADEIKSFRMKIEKTEKETIMKTLILEYNDKIPEWVEFIKTK